MFDYTNFGWDLFIVVGKKKKSIILFRNIFNYIMYMQYTYLHAKLYAKYMYAKKNISYVLLNTIVYEKFHIVNINMEGRGLGYAFRVW